ncbi:MAG TPA: acyl-CoA dehydrogenase family protein, partial [Alphaproteobacteria bacterium]|nr:acyl-CoA dehydrogenase family protein [Alphaproteobacteria bacterium]
MPQYQAPLADINFILNDVLDAGRIASLPGYEEFSSDLAGQILEEGAKICGEVLFPLNQPGDKEGCHFNQGEVKTPAGFIEAYQTFREGGWCGLACDPAYGGMGMPQVLNTAMKEMICSANMSFGMYPGLSYGAYEALHRFGTDELKNLYLPKIVDGTWSGTMCLTEPHCGTDLGLIKTKAVPNKDGSYAITGTKIFISAGEHDLTENIVHLVLAKLPDAPEGVKGISLFIVPKFLPDASGNPGKRNAAVCASIEHKMGIKG